MVKASRKKPKTLSGIETICGLNQTIRQIVRAGKNLKPYQGLKQDSVLFSEADLGAAGKNLKPYQGLKLFRLAAAIALDRDKKIAFAGFLGLKLFRLAAAIALMI